MTSVQVPSRTIAGRHYTVTVGIDGRLHCNCPASMHNLDCWHTKAVSEDMKENNMSETAIVPVRMQPSVATLPTEREISLIREAAAMAYAGAIALPRELNSKEKVAAVMLYGHELGLKPMTAIRHLFIVNGRVQPSAEVMAGMFLAAEPDAQLLVKTISNEECTMRIVRPSKGIDETYTVTWEDIKRAKLDKDVAILYPQDRMRWHCTKRILRAYAPDCINAVEGVELSGPQFAVQDDPAIDQGDLFNEGDEGAIEGDYTAVAEPDAPPITKATEQAIAEAYHKVREAVGQTAFKDVRGRLQNRWPRAFQNTINSLKNLSEQDGLDVLEALQGEMPQAQECEHEPVFDEDKAVRVCGKCGEILEGPPAEDEAAAAPEDEDAPANAEQAQQGLRV